MHSPELLEHFRNPRNVGELPPPASVAEAANPVCGDTLRITVRWEGDAVAEAAFKARGCAASIAAGSVLTEWLRGRSRADLAQLKAATIGEALGGLPPESGHVAALCVDVVRALLRR
jgi:nitrogen fixation protein NifU and related proteins